MGGLFRSSDGDSAERVRLKLMPGFCAHFYLPVSISGSLFMMTRDRWDKLQVYQPENSKVKGAPCHPEQVFFAQ
jgi:hypothetical protein